jgi:hypothetical protein
VKLKISECKRFCLPPWDSAGHGPLSGRKSRGLLDRPLRLAGLGNPRGVQQILNTAMSMDT